MTQQSPPEILIEQTHQIFLKVTECSRKIYTDHTGRFPVTSSRGYKYITIAYEYDSNNILAEPIKIKNKPAHQDCLSDNAKIAMQQGTDTKDTCIRQLMLQVIERIHGGGE